MPLSNNPGFRQGWSLAFNDPLVEAAFQENDYKVSYKFRNGSAIFLQVCVVVINCVWAYGKDNVPNHSAVASMNGLMILLALAYVCHLLHETRRLMREEAAAAGAAAGKGGRQLLQAGSYASSRLVSIVLGHLTFAFGMAMLLAANWACIAAGRLSHYPRDGKWEDCAWWTHSQEARMCVTAVISTGPFIAAFTIPGPWYAAVLQALVHQSVYVAGAIVVLLKEQPGDVTSAGLMTFFWCFSTTVLMISSYLYERVRREMFKAQCGLNQTIRDLSSTQSALDKEHQQRVRAAEEQRAFRSLSSYISHELRNPLLVIRSTIWELMQELQQQQHQHWYSQLQAVSCRPQMTDSSIDFSPAAAIYATGDGRTDAVKMYDASTAATAYATGLHHVPQATEASRLFSSGYNESGYSSSTNTVSEAAAAATVGLSPESHGSGIGVDMLSAALRATDDMAQILNDTANLSLLRDRQLMLQLAPMELKSMLHLLCSQTATASNITVSLGLDPALPALLMLDRVRLRQIVQNGLDTATALAISADRYDATSRAAAAAAAAHQQDDATPTVAVVVEAVRMPAMLARTLLTANSNSSSSNSSVSLLSAMSSASGASASAGSRRPGSAGSAAVFPVPAAEGKTDAHPSSPPQPPHSMYLRIRIFSEGVALPERSDYVSSAFGKRASSNSIGVGGGRGKLQQQASLANMNGFVSPEDGVAAVLFDEFLVSQLRNDHSCSSSSDINKPWESIASSCSDGAASAADHITVSPAPLIATPAAAKSGMSSANRDREPAGAAAKLIGASSMRLPGAIVSAHSSSFTADFSAVAVDGGGGSSVRAEAALASVSARSSAFPLPSASVHSTAATAGTPRGGAGSGSSDGGSAPPSSSTSRKSLTESDGSGDGDAVGDVAERLTQALFSSWTDLVKQRSASSVSDGAPSSSSSSASGGSRLVTASQTAVLLAASKHMLTQLRKQYHMLTFISAPAKPLEKPQQGGGGIGNRRGSVESASSSAANGRGLKGASLPAVKIRGTKANLQTHVFVPQQQQLLHQVAAANGQPWSGAVGGERTNFMSAAEPVVDLSAADRVVNSRTTSVVAAAASGVNGSSSSSSNYTPPAGLGRAPAFSTVNFHSVNVGLADGAACGGVEGDTAAEVSYNDAATDVTHTDGGRDLSRASSAARSRTVSGAAAPPPAPAPPVVESSPAVAAAVTVAPPHQVSTSPATAAAASSSSHAALHGGLEPLALIPQNESDVLTILRSSVHRGIGYCLPVLGRIVDLMGGAVALYNRSEPDVTGTVLDILIPTSPATAPAHAPAIVPVPLHEQQYPPTAAGSSAAAGLQLAPLRAPVAPNEFYGGGGSHNSVPSSASSTPIVVLERALASVALQHQSAAGGHCLAAAADVSGGGGGGGLPAIALSGGEGLPLLASSGSCSGGSGDCSPPCPGAESGGPSLASGSARSITNRLQQAAAQYANAKSSSGCGSDPGTVASGSASGSAVSMSEQQALLLLQSFDRPPVLEVASDIASEGVSDAYHQPSIIACDRLSSQCATTGTAAGAAAVRPLPYSALLALPAVSLPSCSSPSYSNTSTAASPAASNAGGEVRHAAASAGFPPVFPYGANSNGGARWGLAGALSPQFHPYSHHQPQLFQYQQQLYPRGLVLDSQSSVGASSDAGDAASVTGAASYGGYVYSCPASAGSGNGGGIMASPVPLPLPSAKRILVVDDEATNRRLLTRMLAKLGLQADTCSDGCEVMPRLRATSPAPAVAVSGGHATSLASPAGSWYVAATPVVDSADAAYTSNNDSSGPAGWSILSPPAGGGGRRQSLTSTSGGGAAGIAAAAWARASALLSPSTPAPSLDGHSNSGGSRRNSFSGPTPHASAIPAPEDAAVGPAPHTHSGVFAAGGAAVVGGSPAAHYCGPAQQQQGHATASSSSGAGAGAAAFVRMASSEPGFAPSPPHATAAVNGSVGGSCGANGGSAASGSTGGFPIAYEMVLMDIRMQTMHGVAACRQLRAAGVTAPIVAVTGNVDAHDLAEYNDAGFDGLLTKPFTFEQLREAVLLWRYPTAFKYSARRTAATSSAAVAAAAAVDKR